MSIPCYECQQRTICEKPCNTLIDWVRKGCPQEQNKDGE